MRVSNVELKKNNNSNSVAKAWGKVTLDNVLTINITVMEKDKGPWVTFPGRKNEKDGKWINEVFLDVNTDDGKVITQEILDKYNALGEYSPNQNNTYQKPSNNQQASRQEQPSYDMPF